MSDWLPFYLPFFDKQAEAEDFVERCEGQVLPNNTAKIMMHQTKRLVSISDQMQQIQEDYPLLRLLFLLICAENIAKLAEQFDKDGKSREFVQKFFRLYSIPKEQQRLGRSFEDDVECPVGLEVAVDILYAVRCDIVHGGRYWGFSFSDGKRRMWNDDPRSDELLKKNKKKKCDAIVVTLTFEELREIIVRSCIRAIQGKL